jgi:hypothetical protein
MSRWVDASAIVCHRVQVLAFRVAHLLAVFFGLGDPPAMNEPFWLPTSPSDSKGRFVVTTFDVIS